jgi:hypothetical protein
MVDFHLRSSLRGPTFHSLASTLRNPLIVNPLAREKRELHPCASPQPTVLCGWRGRGRKSSKLRRLLAYLCCTTETTPQAHGGFRVSAIIENRLRARQRCLSRRLDKCVCAGRHARA